MLHQRSAQTFICIDLGNTRVKAAIYSGGEQAPEVYSDALWPFDWLAQRSADAVVIVSHTRPLSAVEQQSLAPFHRLIDFSHQTPLPFQNGYATPASLGLDRIALVAGATGLFPGAPVLVIDAGTCITLDYADASGFYHGGSIHPGVAMRLKAMHHFTGRLPEVQLSAREDFIGTDTHSCMQVGAVNAAAVELDGFIDRYRQRFPGLQVLLTGGDAALFVSLLKNEIFALPNLVLTGLLKIAQYNV